MGPCKETRNNPPEGAAPVCLLVYVMASFFWCGDGKFFFFFLCTGDGKLHRYII